MTVRARGPRINGTISMDTGCHVHPSCLSCPLPQCIFDVGAQAAQLSEQKRSHKRAQALAMHRQGEHPDTIAQTANISRRTLYRWLREAS